MADVYVTWEIDREIRVFDARTRLPDTEWSVGDDSQVSNRFPTDLVLSFHNGLVTGRYQYRRSALYHGDTKS